MKKAHGLTFGLFLVGLWLPSVGMYFGWGVYTGEEEKRTLAPKPSFSLITRLPKQTESYLTDRLGFRKPLTQAYTYTLLNGFGVSRTDKVTVGREGWLFYNNRDVRLFNNRSRPFTPEELATWRDALEERKRWLAEQGIRYLVVIVPNKSTIYPEYLPEHPGAFARRTDQFVGCMKGSSVDVLDLRPVLFSGKGSEPLYYRRDTHWNPRGAILGANAICERLGLAPFHADDYTTYPDRQMGGDLASHLGLPVWPEAYENFVPNSPARTVSFKDKDESGIETLILECGEIKDGRLLCFGDSFIYATEPWLGRRFAQSVFALHIFRPLSFNRDVVAEVRPTVVIQLFVERQLARLAFDDTTQAD